MEKLQSAKLKKARDEETNKKEEEEVTMEWESETQVKQQEPPGNMEGLEAATIHTNIQHLHFTVSTDKMNNK